MAERGFEIGIGACQAVLLAIMMLLGPVQAVVVSSVGTGDFSKIEDALAVAEPGTVVLVESGVYRGPIEVKVPLTLMGVDTGEGPPVIMADQEKSCISIMSNEVKVDGLSICKTGSWPSAGILLNSDNNTISNCSVFQCDVAIGLNHSQGNTLLDNHIFSDNLGVMLWNSSTNHILGNRMERNNASIMVMGKGNILAMNEIRNGQYGLVMVAGSRENLIIGNVIEDQSDYGIFAKGIPGNRMEGNQVHNSSKAGIYLKDSVDVVLIRNKITESGEDGVYLERCQEVNLTGNVVKDCGYSGLSLYNCRASNIQDNLLGSNQENGVSISGCEQSRLVNNTLRENEYGVYMCEVPDAVLFLNSFLKNGYPISSSVSSYRLNQSLPLNYLFHGVPHMGYLGNYWQDYDGRDGDGDGVGDLAWVVDCQKDYHPLMEDPRNYVLA